MGVLHKEDAEGDCADNQTAAFSCVNVRYQFSAAAAAAAAAAVVVG